jgi:integrase
MTVAEWAVQWTTTRKEARQTNAGRDFDRLKLHVLPTLGGRRIGSVGPADVRKLVAMLRTKDLAPRTVINTYGLVRRLFADAVADELILSTPCVLKRRDLPKKTDKDPTWRAKAVFTRGEAELLLSSPLVPLDRRLTYALGFCAGMREGEIAALRWEALDRELGPLPRLLVSESFSRANGFAKSTKTGNPREVPVHPALARVLGDWQANGFEASFGRAPQSTDLLIPNRHGGYRTDNTFVKGLSRDLEALGLRARRFHDTRRTFISLGRTDGANPAVLKTVTHDQVGDQFDQYTTFSWETKCEAVTCLKLTGRASHVAIASLATGTDPVTRSVTEAPETPATIGHPTTFLHGQGGTRTRFPGGPQGSHSGIPLGSERGEARQGSLRPVPCHNVTADSVTEALAEALEDFRARGDKARLAARLRVLLASLRK